MLISYFPKISVTLPERQEKTWEEFAQDLVARGHDFSYARKLDVPAISPAEYAPGVHRLKSKVLAVHFCVLDLDKLDEDQIAAVNEKLQGYEYVLYTTWSHHEKAPRWCVRVIIPFTRPVLGAEWETFWPRMNHLFGGLCDPACKDQSRVYFIPAAPAPPAGTEADAIFHHETGKPIDVDALLAAPAQTAAAGTETVARRDLEEMVKRLKRRQSAHHQKMGGALQAVLEGEPFADEGERDEMIFQVTSILVETWPKANAHTLASFFGTSIGKMSKISPGCPTIADVEAKIRRHQESVQREQAAKEQEQFEKRSATIKQAFANGRSHPYTDEELNRFAESAGCSRDAFTRRWIIQKAKSYYLYFNGGYLPPVTDSDMAVAALRDLAPAHSAGVNLWKVSARGDLALKTPPELMQSYGTVAGEIVVDLTASIAKFDDTTRIFYEAPCPLRKLAPTYDHEVDEWLRWLAGEHFETLSDWIAVATDLRESCAAVYLDGVPGAGKTLLADGLARLWTEEKPTPLEEAMSNFNQSLSKCPFVLADETLPKDFRGRVRTAELRQFIQARSRPLSRKFLPNASMRGAIRLLITANNTELLVSGEALSMNDIQAIVDRIIYIYCPANSARYLRTVDTRSFVTGDRIAKHALWLQEHRDVKAGKRFLVEGSDSSLHRTLTTSSGLRSAVCNWLVAFLLSPKNAETTTKGLVRKHDGQLLATSRGLAQWWTLYPTNEASPTAGRVSQALAGLSKGPKIQLKDGEGRRTHYWVIDKENLVAWADRNGYATGDVIIEALMTPTEKSHTSVDMN